MSVEKDAIEIAKREVLIKLAKEEPYLFAEPHGLYHLLKQFSNGVVSVEIRVKDGFVTDLVVTENKRYVFKKTD